MKIKLVEKIHFKLPTKSKRKSVRVKRRDPRFLTDGKINCYLLVNDELMYIWHH